MTDTCTIRIDQFLPYPPARVWKALTDPELLARWLMPNDFQLAIGHGTHLFLEHDGFDPNHPLQQLSYQMMSKGWSRIPQRISEMLAEDAMTTLPDSI